MSQIKAGGLEKGMFILEKNTPYLVVEREFVNPGKGSSFVRMKLKDQRSGAALKLTHKSQDNIEEIDVEEQSCQYLYTDSENYVFMNNETYEQFEVACEAMEDDKWFLVEGDTYKIMRWDEETLGLKLPPKMDMEVTEAEEGVKGDTVQGASKYVKVGTGLTVKVPIFIKQGETIRINTDTKEYQERINK